MLHLNGVLSPKSCVRSVTQRRHGLLHNNPGYKEGLTELHLNSHFFTFFTAIMEARLHTKLSHEVHHKAFFYCHSIYFASQARRLLLLCGQKQVLISALSTQKNREAQKFSLKEPHLDTH